MGSVTPAVNPQDTLILTRSLFDENIEKHPNLLVNLLKGEQYTQFNGLDTFETIQKEVEPWMRDQVVKWMLEVCEEQKCSLRTFSQAVDLLDRYLSKVSIAKNQLQLTGIASVYIASKVVECLPLNVDTCVMYTDYSVTKDQLIEMEFIMINYFKWHVYSVLACDMVSPVLFQLELPENVRNSTNAKVKSFIDLCLTESRFLPYSKRILTIACVSYALRKDDGGLPEYAKPNRYKVKRLVKLVKLPGDLDEDVLIDTAHECYQLLKDFVRDVWKDKISPSKPSKDGDFTTPEQVEPIA